jgi:hypothetical protein
MAPDGATSLTVQEDTMKRSLYAFAAAAVVAATLSMPAQAATDIRVSIGNGYDGATLNFRSRPRVVMIPDTRVYYVQNYDYDLYRCDGSWYYVDDGYWYRASSWRGPFVQVRVSAVPRQLITVPMRYRHNWRGVSYDNANYYRSRDQRHRNRGWDNQGGDNQDHGNRGRGHGRGNGY